MKTVPDAGSTTEMDGILERAEKRRLQALEIVQALCLLERWSRFGQPYLVGSVCYGLVFAPDIDLTVYTENPSIRHGFTVMSEVAELPGVWKVRFSNELDRPGEGLYWQIRFRAPDGEIWKVDNWLLSVNHPAAQWDQAFPLALERVLVPENRRAILSIKEALSGQEGVRGIDIYQAVIEGGARNAQDFREWLLAKPPAAFNYWMPSGS